MELSVEASPLPLLQDSAGVIRIGGTRVTLDTVITAFKNGSTCEEIIYQFPVLKLADVYSAISYYLNNQEKVETYLAEHQRIAEHLQDEIESHIDMKHIREKLIHSQKQEK